MDVTVSEGKYFLFRVSLGNITKDYITDGNIVMWIKVISCQVDREVDGD